MMAFQRLWPLFIILATLLPVQIARSMDATSISAGEAIYRDGLLSGGRLLTAQREAGGVIQGQQVACATCHRRSGLGTVEGRIKIPPIAGPYLFDPITKDNEETALPFVMGMRSGRPPYSDEKLAKLIRSGIGVDGKPLSYLMPRYELSDTDMAALIAYLKNLGRDKLLGVTDTVLHFATIIAPDADPKKKEGMLMVLNEFFNSKNSFFRGQSPRLQSTRRMKFRVNRMWQLHVWELTGPPESWEKQLHEHLKAEPVFAVISGLSGTNWEPVQKFCDDAAVPCLFPNVDLPEIELDDHYSIFYSEGVLLEAGLIAADITRRMSSSTSRQLIQVFRAGDIGEAASGKLADIIKSSGFTIHNQIIPAMPTLGDVASAVKLAKPDDILVLWLRQTDLAGLGPSTGMALVYASSVMSDADKPAVPAAWRAQIRLAYPFDLPLRRRVPVDYALGWFNLRRIPLVALRTQADTFLACSIVAETLGHMVDAFVRDYLIEQLEDTISRRVITGYYRNLSLGSGQRIASKGGYIMRFGDTEPVKLVADSDWTVPQ